MTSDDLTRNCRRWLAADADGRDDDADAEFSGVFATVVSQPGVTADFTARTMAAVEAAAVRDARRSRRMRVATVAASVVAAIVGAYFGAGFAVTIVSSAISGLFNVLIAVVVRMAGAVQTGADVWSVFTAMGRATAAFASDPTVTMTLFALQAIAVAALLALQRLLGVDEESLK